MQAYITFSATALLLLSLLTVAGCGQKGPLYMPQTTSESTANQSSQ